MFVLKLFKAAIKLMSSMYNRGFILWDVKRSRIYIRNKIGEIGLPWGIPVLRDWKASVSLLKLSLIIRSSTNDLTHRTRQIRSFSWTKTYKSLFFATWSNAPFTSRNKTLVFSLFALFTSTSFWSTKAASIADLYSLLPI